MDVQSTRCLLLGGAGQVGQAIARKLLARRPARLVIGGLGREEVEEALAALEPYVLEGTELAGVWGNVFLRTEHKDATRAQVLTSSAIRDTMIQDVLGRMSDEVLEASYLYDLLSTERPDIVVDAINTATAVAYQDVYKTGLALRDALEAGADPDATRDETLRLLATLSVPQLIRHVQILWESMLRCGTRHYLKIGTTGTGGMGLNIPYTHGEERPSRVLMSKAALAGAHTLLLFLAARTPGGPIVKELKPAALIAWKAIRFGEVLRRRRPIPLVDCPPEEALRLEPDRPFDMGQVAQRPVGRPLEAPYVDTGENGVFSAEEFKAITMLNQMEYITPEEIAEAALWEIEGRNTGFDVMVALDSAVLGPTYRAGALREEVLARLEALGRQHPDRPGIAFELLGPPRLSKLLFEAHILGRIYRTLQAAASADPTDMAARADALVSVDAPLRRLPLSVGIAVLLGDGRRLLCARREVADKEWETSAWRADPATIDRLAEAEWIDLRPANMERWRVRCARVLALLDASRPEAGSFETTDLQSHRWPRDPDGRALIDPGHLAGWIFSEEDGGRRMK